MRFFFLASADPAQSSFRSALRRIRGAHEFVSFCGARHFVALHEPGTRAKRRGSTEDTSLGDAPVVKARRFWHREKRYEYESEP